MEALSRLISSVAALLSAIVWPAAIFTLVMVFRPEIKTAIIQMSHAIKKVNKASFAGISFELDKIAAEETAKDVDKGGKVTSSQVEAAARINIKAQNVEPQAIFDEVNTLGLQYDALRRTLPAGADRTRAMTGIMAKMRSLALSAVSNLENYKNSNSPGLRLAAIAIMQMIPATVDLDWLLDKFKTDNPFLFYHAALALDNVARLASSSAGKKSILVTSEDALSTIKKFDGTPDSSTIDVLQGIIEQMKH